MFTYFPFLTLKSRGLLRKWPTSTALRLSKSMKLLKPFIIPSVLLYRKPVTLFRIGLSPCLCWFASSLSALIKFSQSPRGTACALKTFASSSFVPSCTNRILLGALHSYFPLHTAHHQLQCHFFLLLLSPCPIDTHQNVVLQKETVAVRADVRQRDSSPSTDWRNGLPLPKCPTSFLATFSQAQRIFSRVHSGDFSFSLHPSLNSSQLSSHCDVAFPHHLGNTTHIYISSDLLQNP